MSIIAIESITRAYPYISVFVLLATCDRVVAKSVLDLEVSKDKSVFIRLRVADETKYKNYGNDNFLSFHMSISYFELRRYA